MTNQTSPSSQPLQALRTMIAAQRKDLSLTVVSGSPRMWLSFDTLAAPPARTSFFKLPFAPCYALILSSVSLESCLFSNRLYPLLLIFSSSFYCLPLCRTTTEILFRQGTRTNHPPFPSRTTPSPSILQASSSPQMLPTQALPTSQ